MTDASRSISSESAVSPNSPEGGAGSATLVNNPIGSRWIAVDTSSGSAGVKRIAPDASTPVETVTMAAAACTVPRGVVTRTPSPPQSIAVAVVCSSAGNARRRTQNAPTPSRGCRFGPSSSLRCQSCRLSASASAAAMIAPSQSATIAAQGSSAIGTIAAARLVSGLASAGATTLASRSQAAANPACSAGVAGRPPI